MAGTWLASFVALWAESGSSNTERAIGTLVWSIILTAILALLLVLGCMKLGALIARRMAPENGKKPSAGGWIFGTLAGLGLVVVSVRYLFALGLFIATALTRVLYP